VQDSGLLPVYVLTVLAVAIPLLQEARVRPEVRVQARVQPEVRVQARVRPEARVQVRVRPEVRVQALARLQVAPLPVLALPK